MNSIRSILIIKPSAMGDIVLALPALHALRQAYPEAKIAWLVRPEFAALLQKHPDLDEIILFDRKGLAKWWCNWHSFKVLLALLRTLRRGKFDVAFDFQGLFRSALFARFSGARIRIGMKSSREGAQVFYNKVIASPGNSKHLVDQFMQMVEAMTGSKRQAEFVLPENADAQQGIKSTLDKEGIRGQYAVLVPGSAKTNKCWPTGNFANVADFIAGQYGFSVVAVGSKGETHLTGAIISAASSRVVDLAGKTSMAELIELMRKAALVVSNDTGPGHIAAALGRLVVFVFGPTNPARVHPYGRPQCVVAVNGYGRGDAADNPEPEYAIERIKIDEVESRIKEVLDTENSANIGNR